MHARFLRGAAALAAALLVTTLAFAESPFVPNSIKYSDKGVKPATGRSGSASIEARALVGKDNTAAVEITANGAIEKVQVKRVAADVTQNFTGSGASTFTAPVSGLALGETVQVQANVSGVDGARMDVVTVQTTVARRPDLAVTAITAAPHAVAGTPVRIAATVRELNGQTGARASCVLSVAGMDVDRANGIWVDAGDSVSCIFATSFSGAGEKDFAVRVENVSPGDDDASNNSKAGSMDVYATANNFTFWSVSAGQRHYTMHTKVTASWGGSETTEYGVDADTVIYTYISDQNVDLSKLVISSRETTEGELIHENNGGVELTIWPAYWYGEPTCGFAFKDFQLFFMCDIPLADHQPRSFWMEVWRMASTVTYHSTGFTITDTPPGYYTWNEDFSGGYGSDKRFGSTYEWQLAISNGTNMWETKGVMPLTTSTTVYNGQPYCFTGVEPGSWQCVTMNRTSVNKNGYASGGY